MPDGMHHLIGTIASGRPLGMALALLAMRACATATPLALDLIEPLAADCSRCLADVCWHESGVLCLPLTADVVLLLHLVALDDGYTLAVEARDGDHPLVTQWLAVYPARVTALATDSSNNTSTFSTCVKVIEPFQVFIPIVHHENVTAR